MRFESFLSPLKLNTDLFNTNFNRAEYLLEGLRRAKIRKAERKKKRNEKKKWRSKLGGYCPCCGRGGDYWDDY